MSFQGNGRKLAAATLILGIAAFIALPLMAVRSKSSVQPLRDIKRIPGFEPVAIARSSFIVQQPPACTQ